MQLLRAASYWQPIAKIKLVLHSADFKNNTEIPSRFTCEGENIGPDLTINDPPVGTKAFAFIVHDPDAVSGDWLHWSVWNIPGDTKTISAQNLPSGCVQGTTDFGKIGYGGPCPPTGTGAHRYLFELYALQELLSLPEGADRKTLEEALPPLTLEKTVLIGLYTRS